MNLAIGSSIQNSAMGSNCVGTKRQEAADADPCILLGPDSDFRLKSNRLFFLVGQVVACCKVVLVGLKKEERLDEARRVVAQLAELHLR